MFKALRIALVMTLFFTVLTGILYPLGVTAAAKALFPRQAGGSLIEQNGKVIGSEIIGQNFTKPEYFHPRPSAAGAGYDAASSSGSNLGPTNPALSTRLTKDATQYRKDNPDYVGPIPADAITTSRSGLDPHISPANAQAQALRVATARSVPVAVVRRLVDEGTQQRDLGFLGEPRVNVLRLNLALDRKLPVKR